LAFNRIRLKAVNLVGNYIIFKQLEFKLQPKNDFFEAFVNYANLSYESNVKNFSSSHWDICEKSRCVNFKCTKDNFIVENTFVVDDFDMAKMMMYDFRRKKSIKVACFLIEEDLLNLSEQIETETLFLHGNAILNKKVSGLLELHPHSQFEYSLFGDDSTMNNYAESIIKKKYAFCDFGNLILSKIIFTCVDNTQKDKIYKKIIKELELCDGIWYKTMSFIANNRDNADFTGFDEATIFDVIGSYPGALNIAGMRINNPGENYDSAVIAFSNNDFAYALELLKDEININGLSAQTLNLIGACYRLLNKPAKALSYLSLAYYINTNTPYLSGNTCLCLNALGFERINDITEYYIKTNDIDSWSMEQILSLINE